MFCQQRSLSLSQPVSAAWRKPSHVTQGPRYCSSPDSSTSICPALHTTLDGTRPPEVPSPYFPIFDLDGGIRFRACLVLDTCGRRRLVLWFGAAGESSYSYLTYYLTTNLTYYLLDNDSAACKHVVTISLRLNDANDGDPQSTGGGTPYGHAPHARRYVSFSICLASIASIIRYLSRSKF